MRNSYSAAIHLPATKKVGVPRERLSFDSLLQSFILGVAVADLRVHEVVVEPGEEHQGEAVAFFHLEHLAQEVLEVACSSDGGVVFLAAVEVF